MKDAKTRAEHRLLKALVGFHRGYLLYALRDEGVVRGGFREFERAHVRVAEAADKAANLGSRLGRAVMRDIETTMERQAAAKAAETKETP